VNNKPVSPWSIQIQVSNRCNLKCRFCCRNFEKIEDDKISDKRLLEIVDEAAKLHVGRIALNGRAGEPMTRREVLVKMMKKIKKHGMWGDLITNGTLFTDSDIESIVKMGWDNIVFSLDAPDPQTHNYIRGREQVFERVKRTIDVINFWKEKMRTEKPDLNFLMVLTRLTCDKIDKMVSLAHQNKISSVEVRPMVVHNKGREFLQPLIIKEEDIPKLRDNILRAKENAQKYGIKLQFEHEINKMIQYFKDDYNRDIPKKYEDLESRAIKEESRKISNLKCLFPFFEITIFPEGTASPCCIIFKQNTNIDRPMVEDVINKSLKDIWYGKCFNYYRKKILEGILPSWCSNCQL
jgi:MoaA/NifB/PqqE/SkfB family radical SAM enzyme